MLINCHCPPPSIHIDTISTGHQCVMLLIVACGGGILHDTAPAIKNLLTSYRYTPTVFCEGYFIICCYGNPHVTGKVWLVGNTLKADVKLGEFSHHSKSKPFGGNGYFCLCPLNDECCFSAWFMDIDMWAVSQMHMCIKTEQHQFLCHTQRVLILLKQNHV